MSKYLIKPIETQFRKKQKTVAKYLIIPMENGAFSRPESKTGSENIKKALRLQIKVIASFTLLQNARNRYKTKGKSFFQNAKSDCKIPYKTNRKWRCLGTKIAKVLQKHQKSITFFTINYIGLHHVELPYKTNGKLMILRVPFRPKLDFWRPR